MKQIGLGITQYIQDYDERFPLSVVNTAPATTLGMTIGWADSIQPYLKSTQVYQCPSDASPPVADPSQPGYTDYWINKNTGDGQQTLPACNNPVLTLLLGDGGSTSPTPLANSTARFRTNGCNGAGDTTAVGLDRVRPVCNDVGLATNLGGGGNRHFEGGNYGFVDGHVKWLKNRDFQTSNTIWNGMTPFEQSGNNPTFHLRD